MACSACCNPRKINGRPSSPFKQRFMILYWCTLILFVVLIIVAIIKKRIEIYIAAAILLISFVFIVIFYVFCCVSGLFECKNQRKQMNRNKKCLQETLLDRYRFIPSEVELNRIELKAKEYFQSTIEQINQTMYSDTELFLVGSVAERFSVPISSAWVKTEGITKNCHGILSDFDFMISLTNENVSFEKSVEKYHASQGQFFYTTVAATLTGAMWDTKNYKTKFPYYNITDNEGHHHYARDVKKKLLKIAGSLEIDSFPDCLPETCCQRFLTVTFSCQKNFVDIIEEGPAIKHKIGSSPYKIDRFYADLTFSLKCPEWPIICDWGERENTRWPKLDEIKRLKCHGCHFVPQSQKKAVEDNLISDKNQLTWRISFSKVEVELSKLIPKAARICFVSLKIIARDYLFVICEKLRSYHLKSILFCTLENNDPDIWNEENLESCFKILLISLEKSFIKKSCPSFWVSTFDLYEDLKKKDLKNLLKKLKKVQENPSQFIEPFDFVQEEQMVDVDNIV